MPEPELASALECPHLNLISQLYIGLYLLEHRCGVSRGLLEHRCGVSKELLEHRCGFSVAVGFL